MIMTVLSWVLAVVIVIVHEITWIKRFNELNDSWADICKKTNKDWAELCTKQNESWSNFYDKIIKMKQNETK